MVQGYLAHKTLPPRRTLQKDYVQGPLVILGGWAFIMRVTCSVNSTAQAAVGFLVTERYDPVVNDESGAICFGV